VCEHINICLYLCRLIKIPEKTLKTALGIDIGGTNTKLALINASGQFLKENSFPTNDYPNSNSYVERLISEIESFLDHNEIEGIGIGAPSSNEKSGCIENPANLPIQGILPITNILSTHFDLPVYLVKDANAAALGEYYFGEGKKVNNLVVVTLGTGLGCGIIIDGKLLRGERGMAAELGHVPVFYPGRDCGCGKKSCLETYVSARGVVRTALEFMAKTNENSALRQIIPAELDSKKIHQLAILGDPLSIEVLAFTGKVLGEKLAEVMTLIEPEKIILAGGLAEAGAFLLPNAKLYLESNLIITQRNRVQIELSKLGLNRAALLGAASFLFDSYQHINKQVILP
jgi:glucokinase